MRSGFPGKKGARRRPHVRMVWVLAFCLGGCAEARDEPPAEAPAPVVAPEPRAPDGVFDDEGLLEIVRLGIRQDWAALIRRLADDDPRIRARAAFTLASVGGEGAAGTEREAGAQEAAGAQEEAGPEEAASALLPLLRDSVPQVRRDAAFALGRVGVPDEGVALLQALMAETHEEVRDRLLDALGLQGGRAVLEPFLAMTPEGEEAAFLLALARMGLREVETPPEPLLLALARGLQAPGREAREAAGFYFVLAPDPAVWEGVLPQVREALEGYPRDEPAAMQLLLALGRRQDPEDREQVMGWLREGEDPRIRANAARALGTARMIEQPGVREALWEAVENDPADPVAEAAARSLQVGLRIPAAVLARAEGLLENRRVPPNRVFPFLPILATWWSWEPVLEWTRKQVEENPAAAAFGVMALGLVPDIPVTEFLFELADHPEARVRAAALRVLNGRWDLVLGPGGELERYFETFRLELERGELPTAVHAIRALSHPGFRRLGGMGLLRDALRDLSPHDGSGEGGAGAGGSGEGHPGVPERREGSRQAREDGARSPETEPAEDLRRAILLAELRTVLEAAGEPLPSLPGPPALDPEPDLRRLARLVPDPELVLETERGTLRIRLVPEEAPLTVWTLTRVVEGGGWDGVPFHRVEPNFVLQGGDAAAWDGTGFAAGPAGAERTFLPFRRGVAGVVSVGLDREGLQFFITHSWQSHLDTEHTAFGWVVEGSGVLDGIVAGDRILSARIDAG